MLAANVARLEAWLPADAVVLDIGAWGRPFRRADWVLDQMPYETRGLYGFDGQGEERFSPSTWVQRDVCDRAPFPFKDKEIDFAICSHTLEDIRDPVWVCSEIDRVAKAGYIEVPSRLDEQSYGRQGPWVGWGHHHWLVDVIPDGLEFVFKHHVMHGRASDHFPAGFSEQLEERERVQEFFWEGSFRYGERLFTGPEELDEYLSSFVTKEMASRPHVRRLGSSPRRLGSSGRKLLSTIRGSGRGPNEAAQPAVRLDGGDAGRTG